MEIKRNLLCLKVFVIFIFFTTNLAQTDEEFKRFEVGVQFTHLNLREFDTVNEYYRQRGFRIEEDDKGQSEPGFGARFTYNITKNIGLDTEVNFFPRFWDSGNRFNRFEKGAGKIQFLIGPKIGKRVTIGNRKIGFFAKARPGITRFEHFPTITEIRETPPVTAIISNVSKARHFFTLDLGGVVEFYPTKRTVLRFDVGDTIIRYGRPKDAQIRNLNPVFTRHNLQFGIGLGIRF